MRSNCGNAIRDGCIKRVRDYLMRSASRVVIMLSFRNGFEGGRTAVIAVDAGQGERESSADTNAALALVWLMFVFSGYSTLLRLGALPLLHLARLAAPHLLPRHCLHRATCISWLLTLLYTTTNSRTCLTRSKYDTKFVARGGYVVASRIPKGNLSVSEQGNDRNKQNVLPPLSP